MKNNYVKYFLSLLFIIFICTKNYAQMPPHPSLLDKIDRGEVAVPYTLSNLNLIRSKGVDEPWAAPKLQTLKKQNIFSRSLGPEAVPTGSWKALAILVKFTDKPSQVTASYFDNLLFGQSTGTLRDYYNKVSYDDLDIITVNLPSSVGWITAPQTYAYYVNGQNGIGSYPQNSQKLVEDIVNLVNPAVDFSQYDNDGDGYVDALFIIHSGRGAEYTGNDNDIWSHAWVTKTFQVLDGVNVYHYSTEPEYWASPGDMTCGVFAHEMGHAAFGLPDLYDTDYSSEGLGNWSLMASGSWNGPTGLGSSPAFPDAWSHSQMGYLNPTIVSANISGQSINNVESIPETYLLQNSLCGTEYFLVENRQKTSYDAYLPGSGLYIYHIDEAVNTQNDKEWYPGHTSSGHYLVALEQADGLWNLEKKVNLGDVGDTYPGSTNNINFDNSTIPDSKNYNLNKTDIGVSNIFSSSNYTMTADLYIQKNMSEKITISYPTGGEIFAAGSNPVITYTSLGTSGYLNLDYSIDGGITWNIISTNQPNNGSFNGWTVPNTSSTNCKIRISDIDGYPSVISKGLFIIPSDEFTEQTSISLIGLYRGSAVWGDYDNDGDLDILITGCYDGMESVFFTKIYRNNGDNTFTEQTSISLPGVYEGGVAWGDYNNDGYLDILLTGSDASGISRIYRNNRDGTFTEQTSISLTGVSGGSAVWGDYNNDGFLDILLTGSPGLSKIYKNNKDNSFTEETSISLIATICGSAAWGDYDNDADLDFLLTGYDHLHGLRPISKLYHNNADNTFTEQTSITLAGVGRSATDWGDYDNDGYLDILLTGNNANMGQSNFISKIYHNNGDNTFTEQTSISLAGVAYYGSTMWGDYDNDGDLDVLLTGNDGSSAISRIYRNNGNNSFTETSIFLTGVSLGSCSWGDYDNDGDLDVLIMGFNDYGKYFSKIYRNNIVTPNTPPSIPLNLETVVDGNEVTFSWDKSIDNETPQNGLTYNLVIGSSPGTCDILSPMSDINTGKRRIVTMGNAGHCNSWTIKDLPDGQYYWSVQAIDNAFAGSNFAPVQNFTFQSTGRITITYPIGGEVFAVGSNPVITYSSSLVNSGYINLDYSTNAGTTWNSIATNVSNNGSYNNWIVPNTPSTNCKIRISDIDGNPTAISNGFFTIMDTVSNLSQGLVAYYPFNGNANDRSGNGHNGTSYGGISWVNDRFNNPTSAISFDGINSRIEVPHSDKLNFSGDTLSLSLWFNIVQHVAYGGLICKGNNVANYCVADRLDNKLAININHNSSTSQEILTTMAFLTNEWHHLVVIYTPTQINLYVDGQFNNQITLSKVPLINNEPLYFGVDADGDWEYYKGKLDEIRIYNRALNESEVIDLYNESPETTPIIIFQPVNQTVTEGDTVSFTVEATCSGPLGFQWWNGSGGQWNSGDKNSRLSVVSTANSSTLTIVNTDSIQDNNNAFLCEVKNLDGYPAEGYWINTNTVTLTVIAGQITPIITLQPISKTVIGCESVYSINYPSFTVEAACDGPLGFQWWNDSGGQWNNGDKNGRLTIVNTDSSSTLTIANANFNEDDNNKFLCEVKNLNGYPADGYWINTNTAALTIQFSEETSISIPGGTKYWGDYDNDGDLDVLSAGKIYRNEGSNTFTEQASLIGLSEGSAAWGDYDNDGDLDIFLTGETVSSPHITLSVIYRNNGNNTFSEQTSIALKGVRRGSVAWGDCDNDGNLDILLTGNSGGTRISTIYRNNGDSTFTEQTSISLTGVSDGSAVWGDYDNDGDLDILLTGHGGSNYISKIYKNNGNNTFTEQTAISLVGLSQSSAAWGDCDNDSDLDILLSGWPNESPYDVSRIYRNNGNNTFTAIATFGDHCGRSAAWGDCDNDGDLDIITNGDAGVTRIFYNNGDNTFTNKITLYGKNFNSVEWGDYDNDGDLDLLFDGSSTIYRNNNATPNTPPSAPSNLQAVINGNDVTFSWDKSADNETPQNGLHYNLVIGTMPNGLDKLSPMSDRSTGYRRVVRLGNSQTNSWTIKNNLLVGHYYWSVQAIDNCFAGSEFASEQDVPLPVELTSFTAEIMDRIIQLTWQTATEINSYGFEVERVSFQMVGAAPSQGWEKIGFVQASGNSSSAKVYIFTDRKLNTGKYSYRLKMIDNDGTFKYSDVVQTEIVLPKEYFISQNYPNPFNPTATIDYQLPLDSKVTIELYSIAGEKVATIISKELAAGYYTTEINAGVLNLSSGVYLYKITAISQAAKEEAFVHVKKLMIMK